MCAVAGRGSQQLAFVAYVAFVVWTSYDVAVRMKHMSPKSEVLAYPPLSRAAEMVGVATSTLSRRSDLQAIRVGDRDRRVPPSEVMRLGDRYKKVSINGIAADLIEYADQHASDHVTAVQDAVEKYLSERPRPAPPMSVGDFLSLARAELPEELAQAIATALSSAGAPVMPKRGVAARTQSTRGRLVRAAAPTSSTPVRKRIKNVPRATGTNRRTSSKAGKPKVTREASAGRKSRPGKRTSKELELAESPGA
jgi:hypothetical protein